MKVIDVLEGRIRRLEDKLFRVQVTIKNVKSLESDISRLATLMRQDKKDTVAGVADLLHKNALLADQIHCGVKTGHLFSPVKIYPRSVIFKCVKCALEYQKNNEDLTTREKRVLTTIREEKK